MWIALGTLVAIAALTYQQISPVRLLDLKRAEQPTAAAEELVVVTYNVNFATGHQRFPSASLYFFTAELLSQQEADVIVLQETNAFWQRVIGEAMSERFPHQHWREPTAPYAASGAAILSRFPLSPLEVSPSPVGWFESISAVTETPHGDVRIASVHLKPAVGVRALLTATADHRREMQAHLDALHLSSSGTPTIIAGDFNEERAGATKLLADRGFDNPLRRYAPGTATWRWAFLPSLQLDYVFASESLDALSATVLVGGTSDHLAVRAAFRFRAS